MVRANFFHSGPGCVAVGPEEWCVRYLADLPEVAVTAVLQSPKLYGFLFFCESSTRSVPVCAFATRSLRFNLGTFRCRGLRREALYFLSNLGCVNEGADWVVSNAKLCAALVDQLRQPLDVES